MGAALDFLIRRTAETGLLNGRTRRSEDTGAVFIGDRRFWQQLQTVRELKSFLLFENVIFKDEDLAGIQLGILDLISFSPNGRIPTDKEWNEVDKKLNTLSKYLDPTLRRKRRLLRLKVYFRTLPLLFIALAISALLLDSFTRYMTTQQGGLTLFGTTLDFVANLVWILTLGGLGTCGYLGTALMTESRRLASHTTSPPDHVDQSASGPTAFSGMAAEIDLTDANLITTRIVVGILFAFILGYPVYHDKLHELILGLHQSGAENGQGGTGSSGNLAVDLAVILLPFILGFSTTLVLGVMERFVATVGSLFGLTTR
jgi:hypothetical protein